MDALRCRPGLLVEALGSELLVADPESSQVSRLRGAEAEAFRLVQEGGGEVPTELEAAVARLVDLGLVEAPGWDRRRVLLAGGVTLTAGIVTLALPTAAAAQSVPDTTTWVDYRVVNAGHTHRRMQALDVNVGGGVIVQAGQIPPGDLTVRSNVLEVGGILQAGDVVPAPPGVLVSFQEVITTGPQAGTPASPPRYLHPVLRPRAGQPNPRFRLELQTVPTDPVAAAAFRRDATFVKGPPTQPGDGDRFTYRTIQNPDVVVRHNDFDLVISTGPGAAANDPPDPSPGSFLPDATFRHVEVTLDTP